MNYERIEREIEWLESHACGFCNYDTEDVEQSLRLLLDVARAAEGLMPPVAMTPETLDAQKALTALKEHCDE